MNLWVALVISIYLFIFHLASLFYLNRHMLCAQDLFYFSIMKTRVWKLKVSRRIREGTNELVHENQSKQNKEGVL